MTFLIDKNASSFPLNKIYFQQIVVYINKFSTFALPNKKGKANLASRIILKSRL